MLRCTYMTERPESKQPMPADAKRVFQGDIFDVYQWEQVLYDGTSKIFEKLKRPDTVAVVPVLPEKRILLVEDEQPLRAPILTFPAGRVELGEDPLDAAKRELLEETGYEAAEWELWKAFQPVTKLDWAIFVFVARGCVKTKEADPGPGEKISVYSVSFDELMELAKDPRFAGEDTKLEFMEARYNPEARALLEKKFFG